MNLQAVAREDEIRVALGHVEEPERVVEQEQAELSVLPRVPSQETLDVLLPLLVAVVGPNDLDRPDRRVPSCSLTHVNR